MSDTRRRRKSNQSCGSDDLSDSYEELNATKETQVSDSKIIKEMFPSQESLATRRKCSAWFLHKANYTCKHENTWKPMTARNVSPNWRTRTTRLNRPMLWLQSTWLSRILSSTFVAGVYTRWFELSTILQMHSNAQADIYILTLLQLLYLHVTAIRMFLNIFTIF